MSSGKLTLPISRVMDDQDDEVDGTDDDDIETSPLDYKSPEELMSALERVTRTYSSDNMVERENSAKELGEACSLINPSQSEDLKSFIEIIHTLASDPEIYVRQVVAEQIALVLETLQLGTEHSDEFLTLLDVLIQFCSDSDQKVRHNNHNAILSLVNGTKYRVDITKLCCDTIKKLSTKDSPFQIKADAILLLSRIVPNLDGQVLMQEFSELFHEFTNDTMHDVRRAFAYACKELCPVLGVDNTQKSVVGLFLHLCMDDFWSVRKACCEVFDKVSGSCDSVTRENALTEHFLKLLSDNSRWVRKAAFESLGPFLSTFYNPEEALNDTLASKPDTQVEPEPLDTDEGELKESSDVDLPSSDIVSEECIDSPEAQTPTQDNTDDEGQSDFSHFNYWREPVPNLGESELEAILAVSLIKDETFPRPLYGLEDPFEEREEEVLDSSSFDQSWDFHKCLRQNEDNIDMSLELSMEDPIPALVYNQTRVPSRLLVEYLLMIDQKKIQHVDTDLPMKCAYSFPGVAITLGRENWPCLKSLYFNLASELQWKIRRCLACSLHCLAQIYGPEITATDLLSVFDTFLKDIDEVKSGIISHIGEFLEILPIDICLKYGPVLPSLKNPDNKNNWRYRLAFAEQLVSLVKQFPLEKSIEYFQPLMLDLGHDPVSEVRDTSSKILVFMLNFLYKEDNGEYFDRLVEQIISEFAHQSKWLYRLQFVKTCQLCLEEQNNKITIDVFSEKFMRDLLTLAKDKVPNVRLVTGHLLYKISNSQAWMAEVEHTTGLARTMKLLKEDNDQDVRGSVGEERTLISMKSSSELDMISTALNLTKEDMYPNITLTDSLSLMQLQPKMMTDRTADYRDDDSDEIVGEMDMDEDPSVPSVIFPDSTTDELEDVEGLALNIGSDDVIELFTPDKVDKNFNSYQDVDMDLETIEDNTDVPAIMVTQEPPVDTYKDTTL